MSKKRKINKNVNHFGKEIEVIINRYRLEAELTYEEMVGSLMVNAFVLLIENYDSNFSSIHNEDI